MPFYLSKYNFIKISLCVVLGTVLISALAFLMEYSYGNADGIWYDREIISYTYRLLCMEMLLIGLLIGLFYSHPTIRYITFCTLFTICLIVGLEKASTALVRMESAPKSPGSVSAAPLVRKDHELSVEPDSILGVRAKHNTSISWLVDSTKKDSNPVLINIDSLSRRITPEPALSAEKYAMFLGCSYTYGDGVSNNETMPYYFQHESAKYKAYNLGYLAYSPLHALARLQHGSVEKGIVEKNGFAVFTYINDHIDRVIPATRWIELTKGKFPYLNQSNMQTEGLFVDRRRVYSNLVLNAQTSGIKQLFKLGYPKYHSEKHYQLVIDILKQTKLEYVKRFKNNNFFVAIFPGNPMPPEMMEMLKKSKIAYFDYSKLTTADDKMLPFDNAHPAPVLYEIVGKKLYADIDKILR